MQALGAMPTPSFRQLATQSEFHDEGHGYDLFGMHPPTVASVAALCAPLYERYFRVDSVGAQHVPARGAAILIANHAGTLPVDAGLLCLDVLRHTTPPRIPRPIMDHFVPRMPIISTLFARFGAVSGTRANARHLLERGELLALWPEGVSGPAKRFRDRYHLQRWRVGFAELAIRHQVPVIPVAIIGAEESWPLIARLRGLRMFGSPYLPIPLSPIPLPVHFHLRYGPPLPLGHTRPEDADDPELVNAAAAIARNAVERLITDARYERRGIFR